MPKVTKLVTHAEFRLIYLRWPKVGGSVPMVTMLIKTNLLTLAKGRRVRADGYAANSSSGKRTETTTTTTRTTTTAV